MNRLILLAPALVLTLSLGCASDSDPTAPGDGQPAVRFVPTPGTIELQAYENVQFRAFDEDGAALDARWTLDGVEQGSLALFQYLGSAPGSFLLQAEVEHGGRLHGASWTLEVDDENSSVTPPVLSLSAAPGALPGSIQLTWERPAAGQVQVPLTEFELYVSTDDFDEAALSGMTPVLIAVDPLRIQQSHRFENLDERVLHRLAVRVRDLLDRRSALSARVSSESTGHFDVTGSVLRLVPQLGGYKGPGVLVELGSYKTVTDVDGNFALLNVPDLLETPLRVADESGSSYYELLSLNEWAPLTQNVDVTLFVRDIVRINDGNDGGGFPDFLMTLEYLRLMSHNYARPFGIPHTVYRWEEYPVRIHAHEFVDSNTGIDYRAAFERGVAAWNEVMGETLLVLDETGSDYVVDYDPNLVSTIVSGETVQLAPIGTGGLFNSIPERMRIRLVRFNTQARCDLVVLHELGHVLMLNHSPSRDHVMVAGASVVDPEPHRDEAFAARVIAHLPQEFDLRWFRDPTGKRSATLPPLPHSSWCGTSGPVRFDRSGY